MDDQESISLTPSQQAMADIRDKHTQSEFETRSAEEPSTPWSKILTSTTSPY